MKYLLYSLCLFLLLASCNTVKKHNENVVRLHTVNELQSDVDAIYNQLKKHHPRLYLYTSQEVLDFKFDSLKTTITKPITSQAFFEKLAPVIKEVRQGHISVSPPKMHFTKKERKILRKKKFEFNDLDFEYLDNKLWVKNSMTDSLLIGCEVLKINEESPIELIKKYKTEFASDGYNTTLYNRAVGNGFKRLYYRDKGFSDSLSITFKNQDSLFTKMFRRIDKNKKKKAQDSIKTPSDSIKIKKLSKEEKLSAKLKSKEKNKFNKIHGFEASRKRYTRNLNFVDADSTIAIMKIRGFTNGNYKHFYQNSFEALDSLNSKYLILDLRDNGGGRINEIAYLYSYFAQSDFQFINASEVNSRIPFMKFLMSNSTSTTTKIGVAIISPFIIAQNLIKTKKVNDTLYYKFKDSKIKSPKENNFKGKVYVVINGYSFSASSILSTQIQANNLATFVGEETGGAYNGTVAGIYKVYKLPNSQIKVRIGLMLVDAPFKTKPDGYGIKPDVYIVPTQADRVNKIDPELEWIFKNIKQLEKE